MASLKNRRGKWYARIRPWDGYTQSEIQIPLHTKSKYEARCRLKQIIKVEPEIKEGKQFSFPFQNDEGELQEIRLNLEHAVEEYIEHLKYEKRRRAGTIERAKHSFNYLLSSMRGTLQLQSVKQSQIDKLNKYLCSTNLSNATIHTHQVRIKALFNWCYKKKYINRNIHIEPIELKDKHPSYLTENDIAELQKVKWLGEHYKSVFNMYIETGMRLQEPFWGKIKKGEKHNWFFIKGEHTKNGYDKTVRILPHHINVIKDLQKRKEEYTGKFKSLCNSYSIKFKKAVTEIGCPQLNFHNMRDTFAIMRWIKTRDIYLVSKELGHRSVNVTERNYAIVRLDVYENDFRSLAENKERSKFIIRDTDFRDTSVENRVPKVVSLTGEVAESG